MSQLDSAMFFSSLLKGLEALGYTLEQVMSKHEGDARASGLREKKRSKPFALGQHDFRRDQMFWLFLRHGNQDIGGAAARVDTLKHREFPVFLQETYERVYGGEYQDEGYKIPEFLETIEGNVAYLGEFFVQKKHRGNRNLLRLYTHALFLLTMQTLRADWIYAFIPKAHDFYGLGRVYGFVHFEDAGFVWKDVPEGRERETFCAISKAQLAERATFYSKHPEAFPVLESDHFERMD
ncbi:MAG: hypothetical protein AAF748_13215 [Pseudomonadota bacterium]